ncbi:MAG: hypothetical protein PVI01_15155 [Gemmatimonadales bacterium]|jgi:hypothetical protein
MRVRKSRRHWRTIEQSLALWLGVLALAFVGCDAVTRADAGFEVRDSSGVRITLNRDYQWPNGEGWRLSDQPRLDIGTLDGPEYDQLFHVVNAVTLADGRIAVANSGSSEIRFFDSDGSYLYSSGRKGGGPGEFEALWTVWPLPGDSVITFDRDLRRMSVFGPAGAFARSFMFATLAGAAALPMPLGLTADQRLVVSELAFRTGEARAGLIRDSTYYLLVDLDGALVDTLGYFPGDEWYVWSEGQATYGANPPFSRSPATAVYDDGFYFGSGDSYEIVYYATDGTLQRVIRRTLPNLEVTPGDVERYRQDVLQRTNDNSRRQFWLKNFDALPVPKTMPAFSGLISDAEGNLWVAEYRRPGDDQPRWTVFDPDGVMLGVVETPERFRVYEIGSDYVLGRGVDDMDVEHIQVYDLLKDRNRVGAAHVSGHVETAPDSLTTELAVEDQHERSYP